MIDSFVKHDDSSIVECEAQPKGSQGGGDGTSDDVNDLLFEFLFGPIATLKVLQYRHMRDEVLDAPNERMVSRDFSGPEAPEGEVSKVAAANADDFGQLCVEVQWSFVRSKRRVDMEVESEVG